MSSGEDKKPEEPKQFEFSVGGYKVKYTNKLMAAIVVIAPIVGGTLWQGFEWYVADRAFKKKVENYVAPDLSEFDKRLTLVEETSTKTNDYTRDIKNDIKTDIRKLEAVVEQVERQSKQLQRETYNDIRRIEKETDEKIKKILSNPLAD
jgi:gas vesicle protein